MTRPTTEQAIEAHRPDRSGVVPSWDCEACDEPWPCTLLRAYQMAELNSLQRGMLMGAYFELAVRELPPGDIGAIHDRFLGWIRG